MVDCGPLDGDPFGRAGHGVRGLTRWDIAPLFELAGRCPACGMFGTHYLTRVDSRDPGVYRECRQCGHLWNERMEE